MKIGKALIREGGGRFLLVQVFLAFLMACMAACVPLKESSTIPPAPVETVPVEIGDIMDIRVLGGSLRASSDFTVSAKVSGRVSHLNVDMGSIVERDGLLARLDSEPYALELEKSRADLKVAEANLRAATARSEQAQRELERRRQLEERGFLSDDQFEEALAASLSATASRDVAAAELSRAQTVLEVAAVELGYTEVRAMWTGEPDSRHVAERFIDEGDWISVNEPLFRMVSLNPLLAEVFITEKDFARLEIGDAVILEVDAFANRSFHGEVIRVAPVFSEQSRQVRVEVKVPNPNEVLRPGMYTRIRLALEKRTQTQIVPDVALVRRGGGNGIFLISPNASIATWVPVTTGILEENRLEIIEPKLAGEVVVVGQQLIEDGSPVKVHRRDMNP